LCGKPSNFINNACEIINPPIANGPNLLEYWCITALNFAAASQHPDKQFCHLGSVETIMAQFYCGILDQIAGFFILKSDAPSYWFSVSSIQSSAREEGGGADNDINSTPLINNEHINKQNDGGSQQQRWAMAFDCSIGVQRQGSSSENDVWQWWRQSGRAGTQQSTSNPLQ
jgi:hypothetical protein